jgi:hypothetical protein
MATYNKFDCFTKNVAEKVHDLGADQLGIALTNAAPIASNTVLANITEVAYTFCSTRNITRTSSIGTSGVYKLILADLTLTAAGGAIGPFRYVVVYNVTAAGGPLISWSDYGAVGVTLADTETLLIDFDGVNGFLTIT